MDDFVNAGRFLASQNPKAAREFKSAVRKGLQTIQESPPRFQEIPDAPGCFAYPLRKWRYSIIFELHDGVLLVLAIAPHRRAPGYWKGRR